MTGPLELRREEVAAFTRAVLERVKRDLVLPRLVPATVTADTFGLSTVTVEVDGDDPEAPPVAAENITGRHFQVDDRVMVLFQPPRAVFVVGPVTATAGVWTLLDNKRIATAGNSFEAATGTDLTVPSGNWEQFRIVAEGQRNAAGLSAVSVQPNADAGASNYRRHRQDWLGDGTASVSFSDATSAFGCVLWGQNVSSLTVDVLAHLGGDSAVSFHAHGKGRDAAAATSNNMSLATGTWLGTGPITTFRVSITNGFTVGTEAWLYGM